MRKEGVGDAGPSMPRPVSTLYLRKYGAVWGNSVAKRIALAMYQCFTMGSHLEELLSLYRTSSGTNELTQQISSPSLMN